MNKSNPQSFTNTANGSQEVDRLVFFDMVYERYLRAENRAGGIDFFIELAGHPIRLRFAGPVMIPHMTSALAHLSCEPNPDYEWTVCVWDSVSTHTEMPLLVSSLIDLLIAQWTRVLTPRWEIKGYNSERIRALFHFGPRIMHLTDMQQRLGIYWLRDAEQTPYYEKGYPLKTILSWWMETTDLLMLHAAAVGTVDGGVLIAGKSESGKSTTALASLASDLGFLSDDTCVLSGDSPPSVFSIYNSAQMIDEEVSRRLPELAPFIHNPVREEGEKAKFFIHQSHPEKILLHFPVKAILLPRITGETQSRIGPASAGQALRELAPSSILQLPRAGQRNLQKIAELVRQVPSYRLELGSDLPQIPLIIAELLHGH